MTRIQLPQDSLGRTPPAHSTCCNACAYGCSLELEDEVKRLVAAIEEYRLWEPGRAGHAAAHRKLMEAIR